MSDALRKERITKDLGVYSFGFLITQGINVLIAIYIRNTLGPVQMGAWVALQVVLSYTKYTSLGLARAVQREIPFLRGKGEMAKAELAKNTAFSYVVVSSTAVCVLILILAVCLRTQVSELVFYSSITVAIASVLQRQANFSTGVLRAEKAFGFAAKYSVVSAIVSGVLSVVLIHFFALYGYYVATILSVGFNLAYIHLHSNIGFKWQFDFPELRRLMRLGTPLLLGGILGNFMSSLDKIMIGSLLGVKQLGVYSITLMASNIIVFFPNIMNIVLWPNLSETYGQAAESKNVLTYLTEPAVFVSTYLPLLIAGIWIAGPWGVHWLLKEYAGGIGAFKIFMFSTLFMILSSQLGNALVTFRRHWQMIPCQLAGIAIVYGLGRLALGRYPQLESITLAFVIGNFFLFVVYAVLAYRRIGHADKILGYLGRVCGLIGYYAVVLCLLDWWMPSDTLLRVFYKGMVFICAALPVLFWGEKRFRMVEFILKKIKAKCVRVKA